MQAFELTSSASGNTLTVEGKNEKPQNNCRYRYTVNHGAGRIVLMSSDDFESTSLAEHAQLLSIHRMVSTIAHNLPGSGGSAGIC